MSDDMKSLIAYCEATADRAQKMVDMYDRLGLHTVAARHLGVVSAMLDMQDQIRRIELLRAMEEPAI